MNLNVSGQGPEAGNAHKQDHVPPGQNKEVTIVVNSRPKQFSGKKITFKEVVELAFGNYTDAENIIYTVTYFKGESNKEGTMVKDDSIPVKDKMEFTVTLTDRS